MTIFIPHGDSRHSTLLIYSSILLMLWIIILALLIFIPAWILLAPLELKIDTRVPLIMARWKSIGTATLVYEDEEWWLKIQVLFFAKKWNLVQMIFTDREKKKKMVRSSRRKSKRKHMPILKFFKILKTFKMVQWKMVVSADDNTENARWYWLNFFPLTKQYVRINFTEENYLLLVIKNKVWRIAYAFLK